MLQGLITTEARKHGELVREQITEVLLGAGIEVHGTLGPDLLECAQILREIHDRRRMAQCLRVSVVDFL